MTICQFVPLYKAAPVGLFRIKFARDPELLESKRVSPPYWFVAVTVSPPPGLWAIIALRDPVPEMRLVKEKEVVVLLMIKSPLFVIFPTRVVASFTVLVPVNVPDKVCA